MSVAVFNTLLGDVQAHCRGGHHMDLEQIIVIYEGLLQSE